MAARDGTFEALAQVQASDASVRGDPLHAELRPDGRVRRRVRPRPRRASIVTFDGDLQNDPADIPALLDAGRDARHRLRLAQGIGRTTSRPATLPSVVANWLLGMVSGIQLHDNGCSLKVFRAEVVKPLKLRPGMHRYLPAPSPVSSAAASPRWWSTTGHDSSDSRSYGLSRTFRVVADLRASATALMRAGASIRPPSPTLYEMRPGACSRRPSLPERRLDYTDSCMSYRSPLEARASPRRPPRRSPTST